MSEWLDLAGRLAVVALAVGAGCFTVAAYTFVSRRLWAVLHPDLACLEAASRQRAEARKIAGGR